MIAGTIREMQHFQQTKYCLTSVPAIRQFLKERIETTTNIIGNSSSRSLDDVLYEFSQFIEPKEGVDSAGETPPQLAELYKHFNEVDSEPVRSKMNDSSLKNRKVPTDFNVLPVEYTQFKYSVYWEDDENRAQHLFDIVTCNNISSAFSLQKEKLQIQIFNAVYDFDICKRTATQNETTIPIKKSGKSRRGGSSDQGTDEEGEELSTKKLPKKFNFHIYERMKIWYWRDDDGTLKTYKPTDILLFYNLIEREQTFTSINIGKYNYEIDLRQKVQKNITFGTQREILDEDDLAEIYRWRENEFPIDFQKYNEVDQLKLDPKSSEYKKVERLFYTSVTKYKRSSVFERSTKGKFKPTNNLTKIYKIINPQLRLRWNFELEKFKNSIQSMCSSNIITNDIVRLLFYQPFKGSITNIVTGQEGWDINSIDGASCVFSREASFFSSFITNNSNRGLLKSGVVDETVLSIDGDENHYPKSLSTSTTQKLSNSTTTTPTQKSLSTSTTPKNISPRRSKIQENVTKSTTKMTNHKKIILAEVIVGEEYYCEWKNVTFALQKHKDSVVSVKDNVWLWYLLDSVRAYPTYLIEWE